MRRRTREDQSFNKQRRNPYNDYRSRTDDHNRVIPTASIWFPVLTSKLGIKSKRQQELFLVACIAIVLFLWYMTPLSDYCASLILWTVPVESDVALGRESLLSLERKYPQVPDRWGVKSIGSELVKSGRISAEDGRDENHLFDNIHLYHWDFGVVHAPQVVNAFALPGGVVRVTDTLLRVLDLTDGELAALIGHEMGHVLHRHSQKRVVKNRLLTTIWEAFTFDDEDNTNEKSFGQAVGEGLWKSASFLGDMAFSRADEYQADEVAWDILASTYSNYHGQRYIRHYHPRNVRRLLEKLWDFQGGFGSTTWESTHPGTKDRIKALEEKWDKLNFFDKRKFTL